MADLFPSRRDLFRLSGGALALGSLSRSSDALAHQFHLRGQVKDAETGLGLPGIKVSNGRDIETTDDAGAYILPPNGEASIFVVKPAGWSAPRDPKTMLSRIHHQPDPTRSLDFVLERTTEDSTFDVLMFADPQPSNSVELDYLRAQIANGFSSQRAAFGLTLGDLVGDDHALFERYNEVIAQIGSPWWNLPGNHDLDFSAPNGSTARATWRRVFGPTTYAFEYARATFIMLDNVDWLGHQDGSHRYAGRIGADNLAFVEALLSDTPQDRLIVLCMHIPLISMADPHDPGSNTADRDALLALVGNRPCVSFAGHMHTTEHHYIPLSNGALHHHHILTALSGSWWSGPLDPLGLPLAQSFVHENRIRQAASSLGAATFCIEESVRYARERKPFGEELARNQAIQFPLVELATQCEMLRMMIYKTAWQMDRLEAEEGGHKRIERELSDKVSMCNYWANRLVCEAADRAMQVHGGIGYSRHKPFEHIYRHHRRYRITEGAEEIQMRKVGAYLFGYLGPRKGKFG